MRLVIRILLLIIAAISFQLSAENLLTVKNQQDINLIPYVQIYEDATETLKVEEIANPEFLPNFRSAGRELVFASKNTFWIKLDLTLAESITQPQNWVLHVKHRQNLDTVTFYESQPDGSFRKVITGRQKHFLTKDIESLDLAFNVTLTPEVAKSVYLQLHKTNIVGSLPLVLTPEANFAKASLFSWVSVSGYYSILAALFLYYLVQLISGSSKSSVAYATYIIATAVAISSTDGTLNFLTSLGFPNMLFMHNEGFLLIMLIANLVFVCTALDVKNNFHNANKLQFPIIILLALTALLIIATGITLISISLYITASLLAWFYMFGLIARMRSEGVQWANYLLFAQIFMLAGSVTSFLAFYGYIPENVFTGNVAEKLANVIQLILFAVAIFEKNTRDSHIDHKEQLEAMIVEARHEIEESVAKSDPLTGVYSRPTLYDFGTQIIMESRRYDTNCSSLILAIDNFRNINVSFGHELGDRTLCHVADICQLLVRDCDIVGRLSDEELAIVLPSTDSEGAGILAERIRKEVEKAGVTEEFANIKMTVSIGVCQLDGETDRFEELINKTDQALFLAKSYGRNRVEVAQ
ncbi:sensor domain-containing diguanylate cyclase [Vibrio sp. JC009]|uniref:sensor domain-containing diguanylate cyclase n=1 Tax=Vibrio sp. JC009 TaxID=2912314 RepID=UPI0023B0218E|nr:diguanylate cyclase [Vibrio sp. JC009]WED24319.1 sensor domain-containing diguanylate cyclase [Vibrio sp. JC009]